MAKLSEKAEAYLRLIGKTDGASVNLTHGYARVATELRLAGLAILIPISRGGCHVALTPEGIALADESEDGIEFARCDNCDRTLEYVYEEWGHTNDGLRFCPECIKADSELADDSEEGRGQ